MLIQTGQEETDNHGARAKDWRLRVHAEASLFSGGRIFDVGGELVLNN
jgi:hypothetical protein